MSAFNSNEAYFTAVRALVSELQDCGNDEDSVALYDGLRCINGLTDGWAEHLETLLLLEQDEAGRLSKSQQERISILCDEAYRAVHRRDRGNSAANPWWAFWRS